MPDDPNLQFHEYGPSRPEKKEDHTHYDTHPYLLGFARKMIKDLEKVARLYDGKQVRIFKTGRSEDERCPECTDRFTGAALVKNCPVCRGSGYKHTFANVGDYWSRVDFSPKMLVSSELGNFDRQGHRDSFFVIGAPLLRDQDLLITHGTKEVYKIVDVEGQIVAMQGVIVSQVVNCLLVSPGSIEYNLIDW